MMTRFGFSLVTALEPGILLMDEGIATGDQRFSERATERLESFISRSSIIVVASHSDQMIKSLCNKAALMHSGRIIEVGPVDRIFERYDAIIHGGEPT